MNLNISKNIALFFVKKVWILVILLGLIPLFDSCGIYSFTGASLSPEIKTVSIIAFNNQASIVVPSLSETITEKLRDKFLREMNLSLVDNEGDIQFKGSIIDYRTAPSSLANTDQSRTSRLTITVKVKFDNNKDPKQNFESSFSAYLDYDNTRDLSSIESELIDGITDILVQDIFNRAVNNW
jgi:hypothetical protein